VLIESKTYTCDSCGKKVVTYPGEMAADTVGYDIRGWFIVHQIAGYGYESRTVRLDYCSWDCLRQAVELNSSPKGEQDEIAQVDEA